MRFRFQAFREENYSNIGVGHMETDPTAGREEMRWEVPEGDSRDMDSEVDNASSDRYICASLKHMYTFGCSTHSTTATDNRQTRPLVSVSLV